MELDYIQEVEIPSEVERWCSLEERLLSLNIQDCKDLSVTIVDSFNNSMTAVLQLVDAIQSIRPLQIDAYVELIKEIKSMSPELIPNNYSTSNDLFFYKLLNCGLVTQHASKTSEFYDISRIVMDYKDGDDLSNYQITPCFAKYFHDSQFCPNQIVKDIRNFGYVQGTLEYAVKYDNIDLLMELSIEGGLNINNRVYFNSFDYDDREPVSLLAFAAFYGSIKCFRYLLCKNLQIDETVCALSVCGGNYEIIHICDQNNGNFKNALKYAIKYQRNEVADWLIQSHQLMDMSFDYGLKSFNIRSIVHDMIQNPNKSLKAAVRFGVLDFVKYLVNNGAEIDRADDRGLCPLHYAAHKGHADVAAFLLAEGASVDPKNDGQWTPLFVAAKFGYESVCKVLIENGANVNHTDEDGASPLHYAAANGHTRVCQILLQAGALINTKDRFGRTPADQAKGFIDTFSILKAAGGLDTDFGSFMELDEDDDDDDVEDI